MKSGVETTAVTVKGLPVSISNVKICGGTVCLSASRCEGKKVGECETVVTSRVGKVLETWAWEFVVKLEVIAQAWGCLVLVVGE